MGAFHSTKISENSGSKSNGIEIFRKLFPKISGAFHYARDSGNFGRNSNRKVCFGFFWPEYSGSPLEVVHLFRKFAIPFLTNRFFALIREFGNRIQNDKSHFYWLARFNRKMLLKCRSIFLRYSHWSLTGHFGIMESTLRFTSQGCPFFLEIWKFRKFPVPFGISSWY